MRITLQPGFILHHRPYRETSVILDVFTQEFGRLALVARGVRKERSRMKALLQPFVPLLLTYRGQGELLTLDSAEGNGPPLQLRGDCLLSGLSFLRSACFRILAGVNFDNRRLATFSRFNLF